MSLNQDGRQFMLHLSHLVPRTVSVAVRGLVWRQRPAHLVWMLTLSCPSPTSGLLVWGQSGLVDRSAHSLRVWAVVGPARLAV